GFVLYSGNTARHLAIPPRPSSHQLLANVIPHSRRIAAKHSAAGTDVNHIAHTHLRALPPFVSVHCCPLCCEGTIPVLRSFMRMMFRRTRFSIHCSCNFGDRRMRSVLTNVVSPSSVQISRYAL